MRIVLCSLVVLLASCGKDKFGERLPALDDLCPDGKRSYSRPQNSATLERAGCGMAWHTMKDGHEKSAFCCPIEE